MGIHTIKIENFKSIREAEVQLKPLNILIGANGVGKSNFISFFKLLNRICEEKLQVYVAQHGKADNFLYFGRKKSDYLGGEIIFNNDYENAYKFNLIPNDRNTFIIDWETSKYYSYYSKRYKDWNISSGTEESKLRFYDGKEGDFLRGCLNQFKIFHFHDTGFNSKIKQPCKVNDNVSLNEDGGNIAAFLYKLQEKEPKILLKIEQAVRFVAPFFERFFLKPDELDTKYIELRWTEKGSEQLFDAHNFSDGTLRMICLATLLLQPEKPSTIIIDEPELGLHPSAIVYLAALLKKAALDSQVIVSTQSVNLVSEFEAKDIIVVDREKNQSIFSRLHNETLKDWLEDYSLGELWEKNVIGGRP